MDYARVGQDQCIYSSESSIRAPASVNLPTDTSDEGRLLAAHEDYDISNLSRKPLARHGGLVGFCEAFQNVVSSRLGGHRRSDNAWRHSVASVSYL